MWCSGSSGSGGSRSKEEGCRWEDDSPTSRHCSRQGGSPTRPAISLSASTATRGSGGTCARLEPARQSGSTRSDRSDRSWGSSAPRSRSGSSGIEQIVASAVPYGRGSVDTEHGRLAVPTQATLELLRGVPVEPQELPGELVTPTGAAILAVAATSFGQIPAMTIESVGYGTGDLRNPAIVLRVVVGSS